LKPSCINFGLESAFENREPVVKLLTNKKGSRQRSSDFAFTLLLSFPFPSTLTMQQQRPIYLLLLLSTLLLLVLTVSAGPGTAHRFDEKDHSNYGSEKTNRQ
jgi:hypothetical protein